MPTATSMFSRLNSPSSGSSTSRAPEGRASSATVPVSRISARCRETSPWPARRETRSSRAPASLAAASKAPADASSAFTTARLPDPRKRRKKSTFVARYSSMVPWKSRWSWVTLVQAATAKRVPSIRPRATPWEETSIATASTPASSIERSVRCRSRLSGVVFTVRCCTSL